MSGLSSWSSRLFEEKKGFLRLSKSQRNQGTPEEQGLHKGRQQSSLSQGHQGAGHR